MTATVKTAPTSRQTRFAACLPAVLHDLGEYACHAANLSRSGAMLIGDLPVPSAAKVAVTFRSTSGDLALKVMARVARVVGGEVPGEVVIGVEFGALDERRTGILEKLVARVKENPSRVPSPMPNDDSTGKPPSADASRQAGRPQKIALAQRAQPEERALLFQDNDPLIYEGLARNARLSKREIKALTDRTNLLPTTVALLAAHPRARGDENLQVQLAAHPAAPAELAKTIANSLSAVGVGRLLRAPGLGESLRSYLVRKFGSAVGKNW